MKYFLVTVTCYDGEHEHNYRYVAKGLSAKTVQNRLERDQSYEFGDKGKNSMVSFGDGETAADANIDHEITEADYEFLTAKREGYWQIMQEV